MACLDRKGPRRLSPARHVHTAVIGTPRPATGAVPRGAAPPAGRDATIA